MTATKQYCTPREASEALGVRIDWIYQMVCAAGYRRERTASVAGKSQRLPSKHADALGRLAMQPLPLAVDIREAGRLLSIAPRTIRAWLATGRIRGIRLGRRVLITTAELDRVIATAETTTPASEASAIEPGEMN